MIHVNTCKFVRNLILLVSSLPQDCGDEVSLELRGERVFLQRGGLEAERNSDMVKALVRANPSYASSAISSLLGGSKDDSCEQ